MARSAWRGRHGTRSASARSATARTGWAWLAWARSACAHWQARSVHESRKRAREKMKRVGKRTRESAGGATGPRCRAVVEEQAARRAGAMRCDREHNKPAQSGITSASVRCLCAHGAVPYSKDARVCCGRARTFALPSAAHSNHLKPERADGRAAGNGLSVWGLDGSGQSR
jgi:hypothetical protein